jgi:polyphenol oxidase
VLRRRSITLAGGRRASLAFTGVADGDLAVTGAPDQLASRRARIAPAPWTWLEQVHGNRVVRACAPGDRAGEPADAVVTAVPGVVLAVHTADCAGVLLWGAGPGVAAVGAVHAGWRGLLDGVLEATVSALDGLGATDISFALGPCISPAAYEFGAGELDQLVRRYGPSLASTTTEGTPALDLRAGVRAALRGAGAREDASGPDACTATEPGWYSWRARADRGRQAAVIWMDATDPPGTSGTGSTGARPGER